MTAVLIALLALCVPVMAQGRGGGDARGGGGQGRGGPPAPPLIMTTTAFEDGGIIPDKYTQKVDKPVSPELKWSQVPMGTQSFVLLMHDPEPIQNRGAKMDITHWLVWNIPATSTGLPEGVATGELPDGTRQVSLRSQGYMGPGAPAGPYHHYTFELYALDTKLDIPQPAAGATPQAVAELRNKIIDAMDGHVIGKAILVGRFHR
jgi:Raf kinase inhibitor-like YbhB/YbcL family protein